jgi:uncharacterized protein YuzE
VRTVMHITHDKESGALYLKLREGEYDHTENFSERADVYLDVDADGNVLGLEALSFEDLAQAIGERGGRLDVPDRLGVASGRVAARIGGGGDQERPGTEELRDAISQLPPEEREMLRLRYFGGLTMDRVAAILGVPVTVASSRHLSAVRRLRALLEERGDSGAVDVDELEELLARS